MLFQRVPKGMNYCKSEPYLEECASVIPMAARCEDDEAEGGCIHALFQISGLALPSLMGPRGQRGLIGG